MVEGKIRNHLRRIIRERKLNAAIVSKAIGKNHAYMQQFLERGIPKKLDYETALQLSNFLDVSLNIFGYPAQASSVTSLAEQELLKDFRTLEPETRSTLAEIVHAIATHEKKTRI